MSASNGAVPSEENKTAFTALESQFPQETEKLKTREFLDAASSAVCLIERFGKVFKPVTHDMSGNIGKLHKKFEQNVIAYEDLYEMILKEQTEGTMVATDALMWLRRALHFLSTFFQLIVNDTDSLICSEDLTPFIKEAYSQTLEPYHGWLGTQLFNVLSRFTPNRKSLCYNLALERHNREDQVIKDMRNYTRSMSACVNRLAQFYNEHHLETVVTV